MVDNRLYVKLKEEGESIRVFPFKNGEKFYLKGEEIFVKVKISDLDPTSESFYKPVYREFFLDENNSEGKISIPEITRKRKFTKMMISLEKVDGARPFPRNILVKETKFGILFSLGGGNRPFRCNGASILILGDITLAEGIHCTPSNIISTTNGFCTFNGVLVAVNGAVCTPHPHKSDECLVPITPICIASSGGTNSIVYINGSKAVLNGDKTNCGATCQDV